MPILGPFVQNKEVFCDEMCAQDGVTTFSAITKFHISMTGKPLFNFQGFPDTLGTLPGPLSTDQNASQRRRYTTNNS